MASLVRSLAVAATLAATTFATKAAEAEDKAELVPVAMRPHGRSWCVDTDCGEGNRVVFVAPGRVDVTIGDERSKVNVLGASTVEYHPGAPNAHTALGVIALVGLVTTVIGIGAAVCLDCGNVSDGFRLAALGVAGGGFAIGVTGAIGYVLTGDWIGITPSPRPPGRAPQTGWASHLTVGAAPGGGWLGARGTF